MTDWTHSSIRELERASIRAFVESCSDFLGGRVLDYGCGKQPYRDIVENAGGTYEPYDRAEFPANVSGEDFGDYPLWLGEWRDAVLCTQVIQYWPDPWREMMRISHLIRPGGFLVLTYPTCWDEVEPADLHRFTRTGIARLLERAGFTIIRNERRAEIELGGFRFPLGGGALARA